MKVILLSDRDWALAKRKLERYLHCTETRAHLLRYRKKTSQERGRLLEEAEVRKEHIEAIRLCRAILSQ